MQAVTLFIVCLTIASIADVPKNIPIFMPLFVLAIILSIFKSQYYGMSEIEAVTRASGAQITLAKLAIVKQTINNVTACKPNIGIPSKRNTSER